MKETIKVTYTFDITYNHEDHLNSIKKDLLREPELEMMGSGVASDDNIYSYRCRMRENSGQIQND